jgi:1,4-dihydroxy-2-naphthoate octaprenyltransferase
VSAAPREAPRPDGRTASTLSGGSGFAVAGWIAASRPRTLPAAVAPVAVGTACAHAAGGVAWGPALAALGGALAIQIGANFANDAFDGERGVDGPGRLGPTRAVGAGLVTPGAMKRAMALAFLVAMGFGVYLTAVVGWPVVAIGLASIAAAIAYTGGPWPLGYHGLGDVFVMVFFGGVAVCGTAFVQRGEVPCLALLAAVPVGALATAILVVNNLRDRAGDARAGKRTLVVRLGRRGAIVEYAALLAAAELAAVAIAMALRSGWPLVALATAPLAAGRVAAVARTDGAALNPLLGATAQLLVLHSAALAAGIALAA